MSAVKIHASQAKPGVVYSMPLNGLQANEQMTVGARVLTSAARLATRARLSARIFLADSPTQLSPDDGYASRLAANKGRVTKRTGFNYLPTVAPPPTDKVGVLRIIKDQDAGKTVYLNVVCDGGDPSKKAKVSDQLPLDNHGFLEVRRYPAALYG